MNRNWKKAIIREDKKIIDAIKNLNFSQLQISIIVDKKSNFLGTITDGDIRRSILNGFSLNDRIDKIINRNSLVGNPEMTKENIIPLMKNNNVRHLPILKKQKVVGLFLLNDYRDFNKKKIKTEFIIFAGGLGKRLHPLTKKIPKPMIKINGKPILEHIIIKAKDEGFTNFTLIVHHLKNVIKAYFGNGKKFGVSINYVEEKKPLGTAGGLGLLKKASKNFLVTNADMITRIKYKDILDFHTNKKADATICVKTFENKEEYGLVELGEENVLSFNEKPTTYKNVNCGIYVFRKSSLNVLKKSKNEKIDMITFLKKLLEKKKKVKAYSIIEDWFDLGIKKKLNRYLKKISN